MYSDLTFHQAEGFSDFAFGPADEQRDDEEEHAWLGRLGYEAGWSEGDPLGYGARAYKRRGPLDTLPRYLVLVQDEEAGQRIVVETAAALFALRLKLQEFACRGENARRLAQMDTTLRRAFHAWHDHRAEDFCRRCDPEATRARDERWKEGALRKKARGQGQTSP